MGDSRVNGDDYRRPALLSKADVRQAVTDAFVGVDAGYTEQALGMSVVATIWIGDEKLKVITCQRGQERPMRSFVVARLKEVPRG